jgi:hypothetical protein
MNKVLVTVFAAGIVAAATLGGVSAWGAAGSRASCNLLLLPPAAPAGQMTLFGHVKELTRTGGRYLMRFDPAWFTSGVTASVASKEDTGSADVPNDNYRIEEGHRLLTYVVVPGARITVLVNGSKGMCTTAISVAELARIVNGTSKVKLFEPLLSGVWIRVRVDTVKELDQQYQP